jgi:hypothetical protein
VAHHAGVALEDGAAAFVAHQVCVDYAVVQRVRRFQIEDVRFFELLSISI